MPWYWFVIAATLIVIVVVGYRYAPLLKTLFLIAQVHPYEQPGGGAGSVLVIGDSTGYGTGAKQSKDSVIGRFGQEYSWYRIVNDSKNGRTAEQALSVVENLDERYSIIVLQIGANDLLQGASVETTVARVEAVLQRAVTQADSVVLLTAGNIGAVTRFTGERAAQLESVSREYTRAMLQVAAKYHTVHFVPLFDEPGEDPFVAEPERYLASDGLHPSSIGYALWYEKASPYFARVVSSPPGSQ